MFDGFAPRSFEPTKSSSEPKIEPIRGCGVGIGETRTSAKPSRESHLLPEVENKISAEVVKKNLL